MVKRTNKKLKTQTSKSKSNGKPAPKSTTKSTKKSAPKTNSVKPTKSTSLVAPAPVFLNFGHISINVENIAEAKQHYFELFGAKPFQEFPHYTSRECGLGQGFLDGKLDMDVCHLMIPNINIMMPLYYTEGIIIGMLLFGAWKYGKLKHPATYLAVVVNLFILFLEPIGKSELVQQFLKAIVKG